MNEATPPQRYEYVTADQYASPWAYLDAKLKAFKHDRSRARKLLRDAGWRLLPNHPVSGRWRMERAEMNAAYVHTASSASELISHAERNVTVAAQARAETRAAKAKTKADRKRALEEKKQAREAEKKAKDKARAQKKRAREARDE